MRARSVISSPERPVSVQNIPNARIEHHSQDNTDDLRYSEFIDQDILNDLDTGQERKGYQDEPDKCPPVSFGRSEREQ